jgi:PBP1b-binding outer membrane lipoprotein LpoB
MKKLLLITFLGLFLASCGNQKNYPTTVDVERNIETTVDELPRDTTVRIPTEKSSLIGKLVVDSSGKFQLNEISSSGTENVSKPRVKIVDNYIEVDCEKKAQELFVEWKEKHKHTKEKETVTVSVPVERELTFWEKAQIWMGRILALIIFAGIIILLTKINIPFLK